MNLLCKLLVPGGNPQLFASVGAHNVDELLIQTQLQNTSSSFYTLSLHSQYLAATITLLQPNGSYPTQGHELTYS